MRPVVLKAALSYWAVIFLLGFILGTLRVILLAPRIGETGAVLTELPVMLAASWLAAKWVLRRMKIVRLPDAVSTGVLAFALLMATELALGVLGFDQQPGEWLAALFRMPGVLGLTGQAIFAAMPAMALRRTNGALPD